MGPYNGYSATQRMDKYREYRRLKQLRKHVPEVGPCQLCGDPHAKVGPHTEDYSLPYKWLPPAEFMVCRSCHGWIHMRYRRPDDWMDFKSHVARGGYGTEFSTSRVQTERLRSAECRARKLKFTWPTISGRKAHRNDEWWNDLSLEPGPLGQSVQSIAPATVAKTLMREPH